MSRIDEALKRASQVPQSGQGTARSAEPPLRLADEWALNEYPIERRLPQNGSEPREVRMEHSTVRPPTPQRREPDRVLTIEPSERLVVGPLKNDISMEQYRRLAATLHDAQVEKGLKSVMVTSAVPKEGKTLTVVNLALTLSESYARSVLLIDADLRRPSVHEILGVPNERGLSDVLRSDRFDAHLVHVSPRLAVLPSGRPDQNPLAGLSSERMRRLLEDACSRFDWVLLDTPPVGLLSDAQLLGRIAQAAIFVIQAGTTPWPTVDRAIAELGKDCIIGTVLNGVDERTLPTRTYYGAYHGK